MVRPSSEHSPTLLLWVHWSQQLVPSVQGFAYGFNTVIDVNHENTEEFSEERDDSRFSTRWEFLGEDLYVDFASVLTGHDGDEARDDFSKTSGALQWEPGGFVGWELVILDRAHRSVRVDKDTGDQFPAGRLEPVDNKVTRRDGDASFDIDGYSETGGADGLSIFELNAFPAPLNDLTLDISATALRYTIRPRTARVVRIVQDEAKDDISAPFAPEARERVTHYVSDPGIRGFLHAGHFAFEERLQERHAAYKARLRVKNWTRFINGNKQKNTELIGVLTGAERMTRMGTTGNGGDNWAKGDDERPAGHVRIYSIKRAEASLADSGWDVLWQLAGTPRDFATVILPGSVRSRERRRQ